MPIPRSHLLLDRRPPPRRRAEHRPIRARPRARRQARAIHLREDRRIQGPARHQHRNRRPAQGPPRHGRRVRPPHHRRPPLHRQEPAHHPRHPPPGRLRKDPRTSSSPTAPNRRADARALRFDRPVARNISRSVSPAAVRLASHISTYSRDSTTPSAPAPNAALSARLSRRPA